MGEALEEIWGARFQKAKDKEFDTSSTDLEKEMGLLKLKIDLCLDIGDIKKFKKVSKQLKSIEFFMRVKNS